MQKITPILTILMIVGLLGSNFVYADYTDYLKLRINSYKPNVCIFEAEDPKVDFNKRGIYKKTVEWISEWSKQLEKEAGGGNWKFTYEFISNSTHFDKKLTDFPQCNVLIVFDAENVNPAGSNLDLAQGYTSFDYSNSNHQYAFIDIFTWAPNNVIDLGQIDVGELKQNPDGSFEFVLEASMFEMEPISDEALRIVIQHEFGHAMGLGHWSDTTTNNFKSIMMPNFEVRGKNLKDIKITVDDIKSLIELYGKEGFSKNYHNPVPKYGYGWKESVNKGIQLDGSYLIDFGKIILKPQ